MLPVAILSYRILSVVEDKLYSESESKIEQPFMEIVTFINRSVYLECKFFK